MPIEITIPRLGWSMDEGNFLGWLRKDGEMVKPGEPLFILESEKSAQDIEATDGGILRIAKDAPQTGDVVKVGQVIGHLLAENEPPENGATISSNSPGKEESARVDHPEADTRADGGVLLLLPQGASRCAGQSLPLVSRL